jgi:hypothetical protein
VAGQVELQVAAVVAAVVLLKMGWQQCRRLAALKQPEQVQKGEPAELERQLRLQQAGTAELV